ncbi:MAG: Gfo/Idh/MocA family protein, partial [Arachnia sp.]
EALLQRPDVDVVHVCTPNGTHEHFAVQAFEAGKHVVVEKPLAIDVASAERIVAAAGTAQRRGSVPFVYRFHPLVREIRHRIASGHLGARSVVQGSYLQDWLAMPGQTNWRVDPSTGGPSRAFADIGSHWCDLYEFVSGERVVEVSARMRTVFDRGHSRGPGTEDAAIVGFVSDAGTIGTLVVSQVSAGRKNRLHIEISGSKASYCFDQEDPESIWIGGLDESMVLRRGESMTSAQARRLSFLPSGHPQGYQDCFNAFVLDSHAWFSGQAPEGIPTLAEGLRAAVICEAVISSAELGGAWRRVGGPQQ